MLTPWTVARLNERMKAFHIVWFALLSTQGLLAMVLFLQKPPPDLRPPSLPEIMQSPFAQVLILGGVAAFVGSRLIDRFLFSVPQLQSLKREPWTAEALGRLRAPGGGPLFRDSEIQEMLVLPEMDRLVFRTTPHYFSVKIMQWLLCDACGIFGFMLAMMHFAPVLFIPFGLLAVIGMIGTRPRQQDITDFVKLPA